jgi:regulator of nucleoside diphosphate kinase
MKQQNTNTHHRSSDSLRSSEDLIVSVDDYIRLRELVADHALAEELELAIVVPSDRIPKNVVTMNSRLIYADESTGQTREVELVYPSEADPVVGRISVLAPVGCALLGLSAGQSIDWNLPSGQVHRLRVERILSQPGSRPGSIQ